MIPLHEYALQCTDVPYDVIKQRNWFESTLTKKQMMKKAQNLNRLTNETRQAITFEYFIKGTERKVTPADFMDVVKRKLAFHPSTIVLNWPDVDRITDLHDNDWFVWSGFVKPGKHDIVVKGIDGGFYRRNTVI